MTRVGMGDIHTRTNIVTLIIIITKIQQIKNSNDFMQLRRCDRGSHFTFLHP